MEPQAVHDELEKHDKKHREFLKEELSTLRVGILADLRNLILEQSREFGKALGELDKKFALLDQSVKNNKEEMRGYNSHNDKFKAETRDALKELEYAGQRTNGASGLAKWLVGSGLVGGLVGLGTLLMKAFE